MRARFPDNQCSHKRIPYNLPLTTLNWVVVQELKLSYFHMGTVYIVIGVYGVAFP